MNTLTEITTFDEYIKLIDDFRAKNVQTVTNMFLFTDKVKALINDKSFYCIRNEKAVSFFAEEKDVFRCYYTAAKEAESLPLPHTDKHIVSEEVRAADVLPDDNKQRLLTASGFEFLRTTIRMSVKTQVGNAAADPEIKILDKKDISSLLSFLPVYFDSRADFIVSEKEADELICKGLVWGCFSQSSLSAVALACPQGRLLELRALAVCPELRRQGLGKKLVETVLNRAAADGVKTVFLWTAAENKPAQGLYRSLGFSEDGRCSDLYYI